MNDIMKVIFPKS